MPQLLSRRLLLSLVGALVLTACLQSLPDTPAESSAALASTFTPSAVGTRADSLNGMQGHTFGEPLRNFAGLYPGIEEDEQGVYWMSRRERGWFGQHNKDVVTYYQFLDGKFARFRAVALGIGANRTALREEARCLFGPGKDRNDLPAGLHWEGERVRVRYYEEGTDTVLCYLEVSSKPLLAVQQAKLRAQRQADNALSKP